jgi:hypothetical protein
MEIEIKGTEEVVRGATAKIWEVEEAVVKMSKEKGHITEGKYQGRDLVKD